MQPETITIETERLILKGITPDSYELLMSTYTDAEIMQFWGLTTDAELAKEKKRYAVGIDCLYHTYVRFALVEKTLGKTIGQSGYHKWYQEHLRAEVGYSLFSEEHKNKGYMTEALAPIIAYGFNEMQLNRIEAYIHPDNTPSIKLVQRHGFSYEGLMREHYCNGGTPEDSACYSLLSKEYPG